MLDPIRESRSRTRGGEWYVAEAASVAAQEAPPTVAGHVRPGDLPCAGRHGSCNLVADESERAPGHRRPVRCRGVPRLQRSRRSECLHISSASGREAHPLPSHVSAVSWSQADPKSREWVEANRQAIELFQQGADQSDAANPAGESVVNGQRLALLVLLEGDRRQESGDTAGAWDCYRAVLRMATHTRRRGSLRAASGPRRILGRFVAATARDLGGRSEDHDPPAS